MQFEIGGWNINESVSDFLQVTHPMVDIEVIPYIGRVNDAGTVTAQYGEPVPLTVQMQVPTDKQLEHVKRLNDNAIRRAFWISFPVYTLNRNLKKGADLIKYDGKIYRITYMPDDFSVTGWVQVIGEEQLENDPRFPT